MKDIKTINIKNWRDERTVKKKENVKWFLKLNESENLVIVHNGFLDLTFFYRNILEQTKSFTDKKSMCLLEAVVPLYC